MESEEPSEISPLLVNGHAVITQDVETDSKLLSKLKRIIRSKGFLAASLSSAILLIVWCIIYLGVVPPIIHGAVNGQGSVFKHLHLYDINPMVINISVFIPFTDSKPLSANVEFGTLKMSALEPESTFIPDILLGFFTLDSLFIPAQESQVWINSSLTFNEPNYSWVSWFIRTGIKHGFGFHQFKLVGFPSIRIPALAAAWTTELSKLYVFDPNGQPGFDMSKLNPSAENFNLDQKKDGDNVQYTVTFTGYFTNYFPVTMSFMHARLELQLWFQGVPILRIMTNSGKVGLYNGKNNQDIKAISNPMYTKELMELIGKVSDGEDVPAIIREFKFFGDEKFQSLQDIVDGLEIPIIIPGMKEEMLKFRSLFLAR